MLAQRQSQGDTARTTLGTPMVTIHDQDAVRRSWELHEGNRLMYPHSALEILLMGIMQDFQKRNGAKRLSQHARA